MPYALRFRWRWISNDETLPDDRLACLSRGAVSLCGVNVAEAAAIATVDATITMDWSTLDGFVDWSWDYAFYAAGASAEGVVDSDYMSPDSDPAEANIGGFAVGSARMLNAGTTTPGPYARGHVAVDGIDALSAVASGTSHVGRAFAAKGSGVVAFEFDYLMSEIFDVSAPGSNAGSYTLAELALTSAPGAAAFAHARAVRS